MTSDATQQVDSPADALSSSFSFLFSSRLYLQVSLVGLVVFTCWAAVMAGLTLFSSHPILMMAAYAFCMAEALLVLAPQPKGNSSSSTKRAAENEAEGQGTVSVPPHRERLYTHVVLQLVAAGAATVAFAVIVNMKFQKNKYHFVSWHAKAGLVAYVLTVLQLLGGVWMYYPAARVLPSNLVPSRRTLAVWHRRVGMAAFLFGMLAVGLGGYTNWAIKTFNYSEELWMGGSMVTGAAALAVSAVYYGAL